VRAIEIVGGYAALAGWAHLGVLYILQQVFFFERALVCFGEGFARPEHEVKKYAQEGDEHHKADAQAY
jgi:hypothetical protein